MTKTIGDKWKYKMKKMNQDIKQQLNLSMPSAIECIIMTLISMVDTFAISSLGSIVIAAVGAMASIINFLNLIVKSIQVSNNAIIARAIGENNTEKYKITTGTAVFLGIAFQVLCILIIVSISHFIPMIFKVDEICLTYLYIRLISTIPTSISTIVIGHLRTIGKARQTMNARIMSLILNIVLDYIAIKLGYGVAGVAWATVIVETIYLVRVLELAKHTIIFRIDKNMLKELFALVKYGILDRVFDRGGKVVLNIILSRLGTFEYAAHVILREIEDIANDFCYGFSVGITTNVGIKLGRNNEKEIRNLKITIKKVIKTLCMIIPTIILTSLLILLPILLREQEALIIAYQLIILLIIYSFIMPIKYAYSGLIQGLKEFKYSAKVSALATVIKILSAYVLSRYIGIAGAWIAFIIDYSIVIITFKRKVEEKLGFLAIRRSNE